MVVAGDGTVLGGEDEEGGISSGEGVAYAGGIEAAYEGPDDPV